MLVEALQKIINWLGSSIASVTDTLSGVCPFGNVENYLTSLGDSQILNYIAYFLPVHELLVFLSAWVACIVGYYVYMIILKWLKVSG